MTGETNTEIVIPTYKSCHHELNGFSSLSSCTASDCDDTIAIQRGNGARYPDNNGKRYYKYAYHEKCIGCHNKLKIRKGDQMIKNICIFLLACLILVGCASTDNKSIKLDFDNSRATEMPLSNSNMDDAINQLRLSLQQNPLNSQAHFMLSSLLARQGLDDQAIIGY